MAEPTMEFRGAPSARVRDELRDMRARMSGMEAELRGIRAGMAELHDETASLAGMVMRIDGTTSALLARERLQERRLKALEERAYPQ